MIKGAYCSFTGSGFSSLNPNDASQPPVILMSGEQYILLIYMSHMNIQSVLAEGKEFHFLMLYSFLFLFQKCFIYSLII